MTSTLPLGAEKVTMFTPGSNCQNVLSAVRWAVAPASGTGSPAGQGQSVGRPRPGLLDFDIDGHLYLLERYVDAAGDVWVGFGVRCANAFAARNAISRVTSYSARSNRRPTNGAAVATRPDPRTDETRP
ncbi:MAG: hypothetical protein RJR34_12905 [Candidatus Methanoculleus thermohydrogenotrophicum]|nr:hypothetical protein [Candidatus Methanoculleus thermohydrogenotrophicum]